MRTGGTTERRERRSRRDLRTGRTLHVVDVENLVGGAGAAPSAVDAALRAYERVVRFGAGDHLVVACGRGLVYPVADRWPGALVRLALGIDGADRILLDAASPDDVDARYVWFLDDVQVAPAA